MPCAITWDDFVDQFRPVRNHLDADAPLGGTLFETFGAELDFVRAQPPERVWTCLDGDRGLVVSAGYALVNRLGYVVTEVPHGNEVIEVVDDEP